MKLKKITALLITSMTFVGLANAAKPGAYVVGGLGYSQLENFSDATAKGNGGLGGMLFAGYNFNRYLGVEAGYRSYAKTNYTVDDFPDLTFDYSMYAFTLVGKGYLPLGDASPFNIYVMLGAAQVYGKGNIRLTGTDLFVSNSNNALLATAGVGVSYNINSHFTTSVEINTTSGRDGDDNHIGIPQSNLATLNFSYNFS